MLEGSLCEGETNSENQNRKLGMGKPVRERQSQEDQSSRRISKHSGFMANLATQDPLSENKMKTDREFQPISPCHHPARIKEMY